MACWIFRGNESNVEETVPNSLPSRTTPRRPSLSGFRENTRLATAKNVTAESKVCKVSIRRTNS